MPKFRHRICVNCQSSIYTASRAILCRSCDEHNKKELRIIKEKAFILSKHYECKLGPNINHHNQRFYELITPCGHIWTTTFGNFKKQITNSENKQLIPPCPVCGGKARISSALRGFIHKYGVDYNLTEYKQYLKKVRHLSEIAYRKNKLVINPNNLKRGHHDYHLDHIMPIIECFKQQKTVEEASTVSNLQMLFCTDNLTKGKSTPAVNGRSKQNFG